MKTAVRLWYQVTDHLWELRRDGDDLFLQPTPLSIKLPDALIAELKARKQEILGFLRYQEAADALILESSGRLAKSWPKGCSLSADPRWEKSDRELHQAYYTGNRERLRVVLELRERLASKIFDAYKKEKAHD